MDLLALLEQERIEIEITIENLEKKITQIKNKRYDLLSKISNFYDHNKKQFQNQLDQIKEDKRELLLQIKMNIQNENQLVVEQRKKDAQLKKEFEHLENEEQKLDKLFIKNNI